MKTSCCLLGQVFFACLFGLGAGSTKLLAQPGSQDTNFNATATGGPLSGHPATMTHVGFSVAVQPDGKVIAVGTFGVLRLLTDGSVDPGFQAIPPGLVPFYGPGEGDGRVALQSDGRIIVSGTFTNASGMPLPPIFRLNADGSLDPTFSLDPRVYRKGPAVVVQPDGKIVVDGHYERGGEDLGSVARLRSDGALDPDWDARWFNTSARLHFLVMAPDGKIYLGSSGGVGRVNSDGSRDDSFNPDSAVGTGGMALQPDGKVLIGQYADGPGTSALRRLLNNGADDPDWPGVQISGGDGTVLSILVQPDGKIVAGGENLMAFNGVANASLGRLHPDGSVDTTFDTRSDLHFYSVNDMAFAPDGKIIAAGRHLNIAEGYAPAPGVWRLNNDIGPGGIEFTAANYVAREGDGWVSIPVRRAGPDDKFALVHYTIRPGTATPRRDYIGWNGTVIFHRGESVRHIRVYIVKDRIVEGSETVRLSLKRARGGELGPRDHAVLTILDR